jgi:hypothetical protein
MKNVSLAYYTLIIHMFIVSFIFLYWLHLPNHKINIPSSDKKNVSKKIEDKKQIQTKSQITNTTVKIAACVMFRIWKGDSYGMSTKHLKDWIRYAQWAGVSHVFLYDNCRPQDSNEECQNIDDLHFENIKVEYTTWHVMDYTRAQTSAISDCIAKAKSKNYPWLLSCDIDEYPLSLQDQRKGFLLRLINQYHITQLLFRTIFFGESDAPSLASNQSIIDRYIHRFETPEGEHHRTKPLFLVNDAHNIQPNIVHEMVMISGNTKVLDPREARINHYWGNRLDISKDKLVLDTLLLDVFKTITENKILNP